MESVSTQLKEKANKLLEYASALFESLEDNKGAVLKMDEGGFTLVLINRATGEMDTFPDMEDPYNQVVYYNPQTQEVLLLDESALESEDREEKKERMRKLKEHLTVEAKISNLVGDLSEEQHPMGKPGRKGNSRKLPRAPGI